MHNKMNILKKSTLIIWNGRRIWYIAYNRFWRW